MHDLETHFRLIFPRTPSCALACLFSNSRLRTSRPHARTHCWERPAGCHSPLPPSAQYLAASDPTCAPHSQARRRKVNIDSFEESTERSGLLPAGNYLARFAVEPRGPQGLCPRVRTVCRRFFAVRTSRCDEAISRDFIGVTWNGEDQGSFCENTSCFHSVYFLIQQ